MSYTKKIQVREQTNANTFLFLVMFNPIFFQKYTTRSDHDTQTINNNKKKRKKKKIQSLCYCENKHTLRNKKTDSLHKQIENNILIVLFYFKLFYYYY